MIAPLVAYFVNSLWQVPLLALCAWLALRVARPSAQTRYVVWILALLVSLVLPLRGVEWRSGGQVEISTAEYAGVLPAIPRPRRHLPRIAIGISPGFANLLAALYLGLTGGCVVRLVRAQVAVRRLRAKSTAWEPQGAAVRMLAAGYSTPAVVGVLSPVILLPAWLRDAGEDEWATVLAHERAHIRRNDLAMNAVLRTLALPIGYHPATAFMQRRVRQTRELLVDAEAARAIGSAGRYAASLLALADHMIAAGADAGAGMGTSLGSMLLEESSQAQLEERLMNLIQPSSKCNPLVRVSRVLSGCAVLLCAAALATVVHVSPRVLAAQSDVTRPGTAPVAPASAIAPIGNPAALGLLIDPQQAPPVKLTVPEQKAAERKPRVLVSLPEIKSLDPEVEARIRKLSTELAHSSINSPEFKRSMEEIRKQFDSPEFKKQVDGMSEQASKLAMSSEAQRKMAAEIERQVNSPEFRRQLAQINIDTAKIEKEVAQARLDQLSGIELTAPSSAAQTMSPARVSGGVMAGQRISGEQPVYPPDAKEAHIAGAVVLHAVIGTDGAVESLQVVSGPDQLRESAVKAVKTWIYKPYLLHGVPTAVDTTVTVTYSFGG